MATKNTSKKKSGKAASRAVKPVKSASSKPPTRKAVATTKSVAKAKGVTQSSKRSSKGGLQEPSSRATLLAYTFALLSLIFLGAAYYAYT